MFMRWSSQLRYYGQVGVEREGAGKGGREYLGDFSYGSDLPFGGMRPRSRHQHRSPAYTENGAKDTNSAAKDQAILLRAKNMDPASKTGESLKRSMTEDTISTKASVVTPRNLDQQPSLEYRKQPVKAKNMNSVAADIKAAGADTLGSKTESEPLHQQVISGEDLQSKNAPNAPNLDENFDNGKEVRQMNTAVPKSRHTNEVLPAELLHNGQLSSKDRGSGSMDSKKVSSERIGDARTSRVSSKIIPTRDPNPYINILSEADEASSVSEGRKSESFIPGSQPNLEEVVDPTPWLTTLEEVQENKEWGLRQHTSTTTEVATAVASKPIHIMGHNKYGNFIAQSLVNSGIPVTLLMSRPLDIQDWHDAGKTVRLLRDGEIQSISGIHVESAAEPSNRENSNPAFEPSDSIIENLIIASHPGIMLASLERVAHRLRPYSTVCFFENGLGIVDLVDKHIFPNPHKRPHYMLANFDHELESGRGSFDVAEVRSGTLSCTKLPRNLATRLGEDSVPITRKHFDWADSSKYLIGALLQAPDLHTKPLGHKSFYRQQLISVAMHTLIDSVSVAFDVKGVDLLYNYSMHLYMEKVLVEISRIICALPELDTLPQAKRDFSVKQMQSRVKRILMKVGDRYTNFHLNVREGKRRTGMNFYSGYLLGRARELEIECPVLEALTLQVEGKQQYFSRKAKSHIPFDFSAIRRVVDRSESDDGKV